MMDYSISLIFALVVLAGFFTLLVTLHLRNKRKRQKLIDEGFSQMQRFRDLLILIQQHRGLTSGFLGGDTQLKTKIELLQKDISKASQLLWQKANWSEGIDKWRAIESSWVSLASDFHKLDSDSNFEHHCYLIAQLLYLIDDCGEHYSLYELKDKDNRSIRYLWQDLLVSIEHIGQARAIGTGVAASGECTSVNRIRLNYLQQAISKMLPVGNTSAIHHLLNVIKSRVTTDKPSISAQDYFSEATRALEEVLQGFDETLISVSEKGSKF